MKSCQSAKSIFAALVFVSGGGHQPALFTATTEQ
jgi:hypothetical protein